MKAPLCDITRRALAALDAGDLESLGQALARREAAIAEASVEERIEGLAEGAALAGRLAEMKREIAAAHNRLEQVREGFAAVRGSSCIDVQG